jgi:hypothetical protein
VGNRQWLIVAALVASCASSSEVQPTSETVPAEPAVVAAPELGTASSEPPPAAEPAAPAQTREQAPAPPGVEFIDQARELYHAVACAPGGDDTLPDGVDADRIASHCEKIASYVARYRKRWLDVAAPFLADVVPDDLPTTIVYPFGGGDLMTTLAVYPFATEVTAVALEGFGDPRTIDGLRGRKLRRNLKLNRAKVKKFLSAAYNRTSNLHKLAVSELPQLLTMALLALEVHGYEPVSLRYFQIADDGSVHYLEQADIAAAEGRHYKKKKHFKMAQDGLFLNAELQFRKRGDPSAPIRIYRHVAQDLSNKALAAKPGLIAHLERKGTVTALVKAAHYLLWRRDFTTIRNYLLDNMAYMVSDDSGIPLRYAGKKGWVQDTYGSYAGAFGTPSETIQRENIELWAKNPHRALPFVFGYPAKGRKHMLVTRRPTDGQ